MTSLSAANTEPVGIKPTIKDKTNVVTKIFACFNITQTSFLMFMANQSQQLTLLREQVTMPDPLAISVILWRYRHNGYVFIVAHITNFVNT
jgi:hypothetical protein